MGFDDRATLSLIPAAALRIRSSSKKSTTLRQMARDRSTMLSLAENAIQPVIGAASQLSELRVGHLDTGCLTTRYAAIEASPRK